MDPLIEEVAHLDQLALALKSHALQKGDPQLQLLDAPNDEREDWFDFMVAIFQNAEEDQTFFMGAKILLKVVRERWQDLQQSQQLDIRYFVLNQLKSLPPTLPVILQLNEALVQIALRDFPLNWPDFLEQIFQSTPPRFSLFAEFTASLKTAKIDAEQLEQITESIIQSVPLILPIIFQHFPGDQSNDALFELVPYLNWDVLLQCNIELLYQNPTEEGFPSLCEVLMVPDIDPDVLRTFFNSLVENCVDFTQLLPVIQQYLEELEHSDSIESLTVAHQQLLSDTDDFEYWEFFTLTIYADFVDGNPDRFTLHESTFSTLTGKVLSTMPRPPDVLFSFCSTKELANELLLFEQMRAISVCLIEMSPDEFVTSITEGFQSQCDTFDIGVFASLCWATTTVVFEDAIDDSFAAEVVRLACSAIEATECSEENSQAVSCLLYLALSFTKTGKINDDMFEAAAHIAVNSLDNANLEKLAAQTLLLLSKASPTIDNYIDAVQLFSSHDGALQPDNFSTLCEAVFTSSNADVRQSLLDILIRRVCSAQEASASTAALREIRMCLCGITGCARCDQAFVAQCLPAIQPIFDDLNSALVAQIKSVVEECGELASCQENVKIILSFLRAQIQLFKETSPDAGAPLLAIYRDLPPKMRMADALSLAENMLQPTVSDEQLAIVRDLVINPTLDMAMSLKSIDERLPLEFAIALPKLLQRLSVTRVAAITALDCEVLIDLILFPDQQVAKVTLLAISEFINRWNAHPERQSLMRDFLGRIIVTAITAACEPDHRFAFTELSKVASALIEYCVADICPVQLFEGTANSVGLVQALASELSAKFPCIPLTELEPLCVMMVEEKSSDTFEAIVVELASKAKRETAEEIVRHLRVLKIKASMGMGLFDL